MVIAAKNIWDEAQESPAYEPDIWDQAANTNKAFDDLMTGVLEIQELPGWPLTGVLDKEIAAKAGSAMYYHYETGAPVDQAYDLVNEFNMLHFGQEVPAATGWQRIKQRYANGKAQVQSMDLGYQVTLDLLKNPKAYEERLAQLTTIESKIKEDYWLESRGLIERALGGTAQVTPFSLEVLKAAPGPAAAGGVMGGLLAIGVGAFSPLPEELISVPKATALGIKVGATLGAANRVRQLEAGGQMLELMKMKDKYGNKIDPKVAVVASHLVGAINGAIEVGQWGTLLLTFGVGTKVFENAAGKVTSKLLAEGTLKQIVAKYVLKYGAILSAEVLQEVEQETTNVVADYLAVEINNEMKGTAIKQITGADIKKRYAEIITESAYSFGLLVAPGTMVSGVLEAVAQKGEAKAAKPGASAVAPTVEKLAPKPPEAAVEAVKPENVVSDEEYAAIKARAEARQKPPGVAQGVETPPGAAVTTPPAEGAVEKQAAEVIEAKVTRRTEPDEMTREQLYRASEKQADFERQTEEQILGDKWKAWNIAQRKQGSRNTEVADKATARIDEIESGLSEEQRNALYGIGETGLGAEELHGKLRVRDSVLDAFDEGDFEAARKILEEHSSEFWAAQTLREMGARTLPSKYVARTKALPATGAVEKQPALAKTAKVEPVEKPEKPTATPDTGKLPGGRQAGGTILFSPEEWADAITAGYYHLQHGAKVLADWSAKMIADFGEDIKSDLPAIWDEIHGVKKVEEKPPEKVKRKKSKLTRRIERRLKQELGGPGYEGMNMAKEAAKFEKEYKKDPEYMRRAGRGEVEPPGGLRIGTVYTGLKVIAIQESDVDTLRDLAVVSTVTTASEFGQEVKAFDRAIENDPVRAMQEVAAVRQKAFGKKKGTKDIASAKTMIRKAENKHIKEMKATMNKEAKVSKWEVFIRELEC